MLNHNLMILAILDSSGNAINVDFLIMNPTTLTGPYTPFADVGGNGSHLWKTNKNDANGTLYDMLFDSNEDLAATWQFYRLIDLRGMQTRFLIRSNEGADAGTISTAYMRLV